MWQSAHMVRVDFCLMKSPAVLVQGRGEEVITSARGVRGKD